VHRQRNVRVVGVIGGQPRPVSAAQAHAYYTSGLWDDRTLGEVLAAGLAAHRDQAFVIHSTTRPWAGTLAEVGDLARRVASGLQARGVGPGTVVSFQLPNWVEAAATFYAVSMLGAIVVPIVHFYGAREVGYILRQSQPRVHITAARFGHNDYLANLEAIDHGADVVVVDAPGPDSFDALAANSPLDGPLPTDPAGPALIGYTSGTTSNPKGVVHSHRTICAEIRQLGATQPPSARPPLMGSPVGHATGMLGALLLPVDLGRPIHLIDVWDPGVVLRSMLEDGVGAGGGATFFLLSLLDHPDFSPAHLEGMRYAGMGGSAIPRAVAQRATDLGITIYRMYGSTEHPSITGCTWADPLDKRVASDGRALPGVEIRMVDDDGKDVEVGQPGEILSRGPELFVAYTDPALTARAFDGDGWYHTGDVAVADEDGFIAITDRKNDVIIRGGENISAAEVEELLLHLPGVSEVAVVAAPDARLGEHACAFVRMQPGGTAPTLQQLRASLEDSGLARQKWPEEIIEIDEFPRTPSGKVQKFVLRDRLRQRP
jgi:acyl-CoA synthetase (AMP-forming)/AMP-acid ligase II